MGRAADSRSLGQMITVLRELEFTLNRPPKVADDSYQDSSRSQRSATAQSLVKAGLGRILYIAEATYSPWALVRKLRHISEIYWPNLEHKRERNHARFGTDQILGDSVVV
jgi:hypothetical protein